MESGSAPYDHSVVRFSSVPLPESLASCKNRNRCLLQNLSKCAEAGCDTCRLRHIGILRTYGRENAPITEIYPQGPVLNIVEYWPRNGRIDGTAHVHLYTRTGQAKTLWPIVGVGREVDDRRRGYASVVAEWLRTCREDHPACSSNMNVPLPTRLLDVGPLESDSIRLIVTTGQKGSYIALSHCWGGGIEMRTTRDSIEARKRQILYSELPRTFQDAVTVTRDVSLRYLWIDALCIVQDDSEDWEKESGNMAAIYHNAYTVLGADKSSDSHSGFLDASPGGYHGDGELIAAVDSENSMIYARLTFFHNNPCPIFKNGLPEPLARRAWTMQEQMLASRMIHFAQKEMIWECNSALLCECMELDAQYSGSLAQNDKPTLMASPWSSSSFKTWYKIVTEVTSRDITKPQDILPCLSGLARRFQDCGAGTYLAGLWLDDLLLGLLWTGSDRCSRVTPYRAPSWSWASVCIESKIANPLYNTGGFLDENTKLNKTFARILEAKCTAKGKDPLGAVSDGYIKIAAPLLEMAHSKYRGHTNTCDLTPLGLETGSRKLTASFDSQFIPNPDENLFCLFVGELSCGAESRPFRGLVLLKRCDISGITFERIGSFNLARGEEQHFIQGVEHSVVVII